MSVSFNRKAIMQKAHARTRAMMALPLYRAAGYRVIFAAALKRAWTEATPYRRDAARLEQNIGLPLRSCTADRPARRVHDRHSGRLYANFAA